MIPLMWCDLETTGLNEYSDQILELALFATDEHLRVQGSFAATIYQDPAWLEANLSPKARELHTANGLLAEVQEFVNRGPRAAEQDAVEWMQAWGFEGRVMAGSNPDFDRRFLRLGMPMLEKKFHYRNFDMNTLYYFLGVDKDKNRQSRHRAVRDLQDDITKAQEMFKEFARV